MDKAPDAFRTISEVAEVLETPAHVLRFWESRFPQIKPVKRAGGRRYYRPADVALLSGIRQLLHTEGMTIRGVQKVLRELGVRHVAGLGGEVGDLDLEADLDLMADATDEVPVSGSVVVSMPALPRRPADDLPLSAASVETLFPPPEPDTVPSPMTEVPRDGEGGFIAFSPPRPVRPKPALDPKQPLLPFAPLAQSDAIPDAPYVFAEPEPRPEATVSPIVAAPSGQEVVGPEPAEQTDRRSAEVPDLAGLAARLRRLAQPLSPATAAALAEAHSRLGLLHAQMAEAQRLRRPAV